MSCEQDPSATQRGFPAATDARCRLFRVYNGATDFDGTGRIPGNAGCPPRLFRPAQSTGVRTRLARRSVRQFGVAGQSLAESGAMAFCVCYMESPRNLFGEGSGSRRRLLGAGGRPAKGPSREGLICTRPRSPGDSDSSIGCPRRVSDATFVKPAWRWLA